MKKYLVVFIFAIIYNTLSSQNLYPYKKDGSWGYIDTTGKVIIPAQYKLAGFFSEGLAYVQIGGALGYIDETNKEVIKSKYPAAYNFNEGFCSVMEDEDWGVINTKGEMVIEPKYAAPMMFHNGLARFKLERGLFSTYGFINTKGDTAIYPRYEKLSEFSDGVCMASTDGYKYGYINTKGEWVIQPTMELGALFKINGEYDFSDKDFSNGYIAVSKKEKYGLMDKTGKIVLDYKFDFIGRYAEGLAPAKKDSLYGYIDLKGNWIIKPKYNGAEVFSNGLAAVSKGPYLEEKWGFIDHSGKIIIPITIYSNFDPYKPMVFLHGVIPCYIESGVFGYINRAGKVIWKME